MIKASETVIMNARKGMTDSACIYTWSCCSIYFIQRQFRPPNHREHGHSASRFLYVFVNNRFAGAGKALVTNMKMFKVFVTLLWGTLTFHNSYAQKVMNATSADGKTVAVDIGSYQLTEMRFNGDVMTVTVDGQSKNIDANVGLCLTFADQTTVYKKSISSVGYSTYAPPQDVRIPSGVMAFYAVSVEDKKVSLESIDTGNVPAGEGLVLKGSSGEYSFEGILFPNQATAVADNKLIGTLKDITVTPYSVYMLGNIDGVGFYKYAGQNIKAQYAYLNMTSAHNAPEMLVFDDGTAMDIESVTQQGKTDQPKYDLMGRRVNNAYKGIIISNGKRIIKR